jgi:hypothetical protein
MDHFSIKSQFNEIIAQLRLMTATCKSFNSMLDQKSYMCLQILFSPRECRFLWVTLHLFSYNSRTPGTGAKTMQCQRFSLTRKSVVVRAIQKKNSKWQLGA